MCEGVDIGIYLLLHREMDLLLPCLNYVPVSVHVDSVACLYLVFVQYQVPCVLGAQGECYMNCVFLYIASPYINPNMNSSPVPEC